MKRRKICLLLIIVFTSVILTACGCSSGRIQQTQSTIATETGSTTPTEAETTDTETEETIQIQSLEGIMLEGNPELPYEIHLFSKATEAIEKPLKISVKEEAEKRKISFSFIGEYGETIIGITKGLIIEKNEDFTYTREDVSYIGDIATFAINMPNSVEKSTVAVYEISFTNEGKEYSCFFAFDFQ